MFFNQYPYTDNNQLNLDWLLNTVKTVANGFDSVKEIAEQASYDAASALKTLEEVETDFSETVAELQAIVDEYKDEMQASVAATMLEYVTAWTTALNATRTELTAYVDSNVSDLTDAINDAVENLEAQIAAISVNLQVVNPYTGETTGLQELLYEMLEWDRLFAWTAGEFDGYELMTAEYFDSFDLTTKEWDFAGRFYQYWKPLWEALPSVDLDELTNRVAILENMDTVPTAGSTRACTSGGIYNAISAISTLSFEVVTSLPTEDIQTDVIYLMLSSTASTDNIYDEYIYVNGSWEIIGSTSIDLSNYLQTSDVDTTLSTSSSNPIANSAVATAVNTINSSLGSLSEIGEITIASNGTSQYNFPSTGVYLCWAKQGGALTNRNGAWLVYATSYDESCAIVAIHSETNAPTLAFVYNDATGIYDVNVTNISTGLVRFNAVRL